MFGTGEFEFSPWKTPFENAQVEILEVAYSPLKNWPRDEKPHYRDLSLLKEPAGAELVIRVYVYEGARFYRVGFDRVSAYRVLDEGGLLELWGKTKELGGRPGHATFRVRNHAWSQESPVSFLMTDGWSYVIATDSDCVEIVAPNPPMVTPE